MVNTKEQQQQTRWCLIETLPSRGLDTKNKMWRGVKMLGRFKPIPRLPDPDIYFTWTHKSAGRRNWFQKRDFVRFTRQLREFGHLVPRPSIWWGPGRRHRTY